MNIDVTTSQDVKPGRHSSSSSYRLAPVASPGKEPSAHGVSTRNVPKWYALRTTYGRERKAYEYIIGEKGKAFYPTRQVTKRVNGKIQTVEESLIPNIFFAFGLEDEIKSFVYDNVHLPFLRFYYRHCHVGTRIEKTPLVVPQVQMEGLKVICESENENIVVSKESIRKFETGQMVKITGGPFAGVEGRVARYKGQQRVGIIIDGLLTITTAYIPDAFIEKIETDK